MDIFVARQPIFDRRKKCFGYELLFRNGLTNAFPDINGDIATSKVLSNSFFGMGINRLVEDKMAFVNFPQKLLIAKTAMMFPFDKLMVEILETVEPTEEIVNACEELVVAGYGIALDDFVMKEGYQPLVDLCNIIKIDFMISSIQEIEEMIAELNNGRIKFLAEKIETHAQFEIALEMGFVYFQGYFFEKPEILHGKEIASSKLTLLQILGEISKGEYDVPKLEELISRDVSISYKLLRYINSAFFHRALEISSIRHAIILLGEKEVKKFLALITAAELASDKPSELIRASIIRARMCELIGRDHAPVGDQSSFFLVGLFSLVDAMLDRQMTDIVKELPLPFDVEKALANGHGQMADCLALVSSYEKGDWQEFGRTNLRLKIDEEKFPQYYTEALKWAEAYTQI